MTQENLFDPFAVEDKRPLAESCDEARKDIEQILFSKQFRREIIKGPQGSNWVISAPDIAPYLGKLPQVQSPTADFGERIKNYYKEGLISRENVKLYVRKMISLGEQEYLRSLVFHLQEADGSRTTLFKGQEVVDFFVALGKAEMYGLISEILYRGMSSVVEDALDGVKVLPESWIPIVEGAMDNRRASRKDFKTAAVIAIGFADARENEPSLKKVLEWTERAGYLYDENHGLHRFFYLFLFLAFNRNESIKPYCKEIAGILHSAFIYEGRRGSTFTTDHMLETLFEQDFVEDSTKLEILEGFKERTRESVWGEYEKNSANVRNLYKKFSKKPAS